MSTPASFHIVRLDGIHCAPPDLPIPHTYTEYATTSPDTTASRISTADIVITTRVPLTASDLDPKTSPNLKLVVVMAIGTDMLDLAACAARGIPVCNVPAASNESVSQHAVSLYMAVRRRVVKLHELVLQGDKWKKTGSLAVEFGGLPGGWKDEVVGIIGVGELGNRVAGHCSALGMKVLFTERKGLPENETRTGRTSFETTLKTATVLVVTCPLSASTINMIGLPELKLMRPESILVNVARGGIVLEEAVVEALKEKWIAGAGFDVFVEEPADPENSVLVREGRSCPNLVLSPHVAWYGRSSIDKLRRVVTENIVSFAAGKVINAVPFIAPKQG